MGGNAIVVFELDNIAGPVTNIMNLFQHRTMRRIAGNPLLVPLLALVSSKIASPSNHIVSRYTTFSTKRGSLVTKLLFSVLYIGKDHPLLVLFMQLYPKDCFLKNYYVKIRCIANFS